jgi:hypothetical protein
MLLRKVKKLNIDTINNLVNNITMTDKNNNIVIELDSVEKDCESVKVLVECIHLQLKKGRDYQSTISTVKQFDYYPSGVRTIHEIMHTKMTRLKSLIEKFEAAGAEPNFESIEDSLKDLINYSSFAVSCARHKMDGQPQNTDILNRPIPISNITAN